MPDPYARLAGVYDELVVDPAFMLWADFVTAAWADDPAGVRWVLDVCCGTGLMTAELRARGLDVVGLDASAQMLTRARERLGPDVALVEATLPDVPHGVPALAAPFDALVSTYDGFNYLEPADLGPSFDLLAGLVRPGGWLMFDVLTDASLALAAENPVVLGVRNDTRFSVTYVVRDRSVRSIMSLAIDGQPDAAFVEEHRQHIHAPEEIRAALGSAGFDVVGTYDDYTDSPTGPHTLRATWVARRPRP